jgi:hypothetical protein
VVSAEGKAKHDSSWGKYLGRDVTLPALSWQLETPYFILRSIWSLSLYYVRFTEGSVTRLCYIADSDDDGVPNVGEAIGNK